MPLKRLSINWILFDEASCNFFSTQPFEIVHINFLMKFRMSMFDWINDPRMMNLKIKKESFDQLRIEESIKKLKYLNRKSRIHIIYAGEYYHRNFNTLKSMIYKAMKKLNVKTRVLHGLSR